MYLPYSNVGWSVVCDCGITAHTHLILYRFFFIFVNMFISYSVKNENIFTFYSRRSYMRA